MAHRHGAAHPRSPRTTGWFPPRSRAPVETPRLRPTSPPRSRPSLGARDKQPCSSPARRTEALSANHSSTVLRTDGVRPPFPTMAVTGVPSAKLRSLLCHPGRCGDTMGPATWDGACPALLPALFRQPRPSGLYVITRMAPGPPLAREEVRETRGGSGPLEGGGGTGAIRVMR